MLQIWTRLQISRTGWARTTKFSPHLFTSMLPPEITSSTTSGPQEVRHLDFLHWTAFCGNGLTEFQCRGPTYSLLCYHRKLRHQLLPVRRRSAILTFYTEQLFSETAWPNFTKFGLHDQSTPGHTHSIICVISPFRLEKLPFWKNRLSHFLRL